MVTNCKPNIDPVDGQKQQIGVNEGPFRRILKNAIKVLAGSGASTLIGLASTACLTRALSVSDFGVFALLLSFANLIAAFATFSTWQALIHFLNKPDKAKYIKFSLVLDTCARVIGVTAIWIGYPFFVESQKVSDAAQGSLVWLVILAFFTESGTPTALLRFSNRFSALVALETLPRLLRLGLVAYLAFMGTSVVAPFLMCFAIEGVVRIVACHAYSAQRLKADYNLTVFDILVAPLVRARDFLKFNFNAYLSSSVRVCSTDGVSMLVGYFLGPTSAGFYRLMLQLAGFVNKLPMPFYQVIYPEFSRLVGQDKHSELIGVQRKIFILFATYSVIALGVYALFGSYLIALVFGSKYSVIYKPFFFYLAVFCLSLFTLTIVPTLWSYGRSGSVLLLNLVTTTIQLLVMVVTIKAFGLHSVTISLFAYVIAFWLLGIYLMRKGQCLSQQE